MNNLLETFREFFSPFYYYDNSGRAYIEYSCGEKEGYTGKIGFFHFSMNNSIKNAKYNFKIFEFIKQSYPSTITEILELFQHCIKHNCIISIVSLNEDNYLLRVSQGDNMCREIISNSYKKHTGYTFVFPHDNSSCPIEIDISTSGGFTLNGLQIYQKIPLPNRVNYVDGYLNENNIFLTISSKKYNNLLYKTGEKIGYKLYETIPFLESKTLQDKYFHKYLDGNFTISDIYMNYIEIDEEEDNISFTSGYSIES